MRFVQYFLILVLLGTACNKKVVAPAVVIQIPVTRDNSDSDILTSEQENQKREILLKIKHLEEQKLKSRKEAEFKASSDNEKFVGYLDNHSPGYMIVTKEKKKTPDADKKDNFEIDEELKPLKAMSDSKSEDGSETVPKVGSEEVRKEVSKEVRKEVSKEVSGKGSVSVATVKASSHDDNEEFTAYRKFCKSSHKSLTKDWKIDESYVIKIIDKDNNPVPNVEVKLQNAKGVVWKALTQSSGEIVLFPLLDLGQEYKTIRDYSIFVANVIHKVVPGNDSYITIQIKNSRKIAPVILVQICFLLDATGSMGDEIQILKNVIFSIYSRLGNHPAHPKMEFSVVAYRDRDDEFLVKGIDFTDNIDSFQVALESITARGGGDRPEDIDAGLQFTLDSLTWNKNDTKFIFLIGDAAPHFDYGNKKDYLWASRAARENAIMITPIGASGLGLAGEFAFRQMALLTSGEFVFLHYGEEGESSGAATSADPGKVSHHTGSNYNARRLDDIVIDIITKELGYLVENPKLVQTASDPQKESEHLDARLEGMLEQVFRSDLSLQGKTVAFAPFSFSDTNLQTTADYLWEGAIERTVNFAPVNVVERTRLEDVLKENALQLSGLMVDNPDSNIGKMLSADFMVFGKIHFIGAVRVCHIRLVDCLNGNIVSASRVKL
jgi:hypothetical protein